MFSGQNRGSAERPILAVHINKENKAERLRTSIKEKSQGMGKVMQDKGLAVKKPEVMKQPAMAAAVPPEFSFGGKAGAQKQVRMAPAKVKGSVKGTKKKVKVKKKGGFGGK